MNTNNTYIVLMPINSCERSEAEQIENKTYSSIEYLYGIHYGKDILVVSLSEFVDLMNDQDEVTDGDKYWMTYVQINK